MLRLRISSLVCLCALAACFRPSSDGARPGDAGAADASSRDAGAAFADGRDAGPSCGNGGPCVTGKPSAFPPCSDDMPTCDQATRTAVCDRLITCDVVPGPELDPARCNAEITVLCTACMQQALDLDSDGSVVDCDRRCADPCGLLAVPPEDPEQCMELLAPFARPVVQDACFCAVCLSELANCVANDACWLVVQCALRTGCTDTACLSAETCEGAVDLVGLGTAAISNAMALGACMNNCAP